jgi:putative membrane protein
MYAVGVRRFPHRRRALFVLGYTALLVALLSPLHALGETLFSVHMVQHLLLTLVAAPLLLASNSMPVFMWALPQPQRSSVGHFIQKLSVLRWLTLPVVAWTLFVATQWLWHLPVVYEAALHNRFLHYAEHVAFFVTAVLFWWPVIGAAPLRSPLNYPARMAYTFLAWLPNSILGAGITLSRAALYPSYSAADQEIAGLIMWVPGDVLFAIILMVLFGAFMRNEERKAARIDRILDAREAALSRTAASTASRTPPSP